MTRVAITGASGFIGSHLLESLASTNLKTIALSRSRPSKLPSSIEWRETDLFSAQSTHNSLRDVDVAIYLIHSMLPSTSLFQGSFHDTDLLLADNFAKACQKQGVKQIIYLGGLLPKDYISLHLQSRNEVEGVLRSSEIPVTVFRAGMITGPEGSSFNILRTLVERLPFMVLPAWTQNQTQAVFIDDVVRVIQKSIHNLDFYNQTLDLVNGESLTYELLLRQMAQVLQLNRKMLPVPIRSVEFSKLWVTLFGNSHYELVSPLIDSLLCDLPASKPSPLIEDLIFFKTFSQMTKETLKRAPHLPVDSPLKRLQRKKRRQNTVRSIQRLPAMISEDCHWLSQEYMKWLPQAFYSMILVRVDNLTGKVQFRLLGIQTPLLELQYIPSTDLFDREKFHIVGGFLTATTDTGWLEFRQVDHKRYTLACIHEFVPRLPWFVYLFTQAILHEWTMNQFGKYLNLKIQKESENSGTQGMNH